MAPPFPQHDAGIDDEDGYHESHESEGDYNNDEGRANSWWQRRRSNDPGHGHGEADRWKGRY